MIFRNLDMAKETSENHKCKYGTKTEPTEQKITHHLSDYLYKYFVKHFWKKKFKEYYVDMN